MAPIEELVAALAQAIDAAENHLKGLGFDPARLQGATGFPRIQTLRDAVDAIYTSDEAKRRFEIIARQVFIRFKALLMEPSACTATSGNEARAARLWPQRRTLRDRGPQWNHTPLAHGDGVVGRLPKVV